VFEKPRQEIAVKGLFTKVKSARVVGSGSELKFEVNGGAAWVNIPGILYIEVPEQLLDDTATVIAVDFEKELEIYHGPGQASAAGTRACHTAVSLVFRLSA
jgi:alpha-L-fucosidase